MLNNTSQDHIVNTILAAQNAPTGIVDLYGPVSENDTDRNDLLVFLKPELTRVTNRDSLHSLLQLINQTFDRFDVHIRAVKLFGADYLRRTQYMNVHYGTMNAIATDPRRHIAPESRSKFEQIYGHSVDKVKAVGALTWLHSRPDISATDLYNMWQTKQPGVDRHKIGPGTHCALMNELEDGLYLFNGGFPGLMDHYTRPHHSILAMHVTTPSDFSILRRDMIGVTNPAKATEGSLRAACLARADALHLGIIDDVWNGFHMSAGPLEAAVELTRFAHGPHFTAPELAYTNFGSRLIDVFGLDEAFALAQNATLYNRGQSISAYDMTEELSPDAALTALQSAVILDTVPVSTGTPLGHRGPHDARERVFGPHPVGATPK